MKSSNPLVMVQAYRLLIDKMQSEFGECYPLHLGVTEAGDGEDGRIKSAIGIGTLLEDGIGDTIRVSLTEDPEFEIPVCKDNVRKYEQISAAPRIAADANTNPINPFEYHRRATASHSNIGGKLVPIVVADFMHQTSIQPADLQSIGYTYNELSDKWSIGDAAADYIYTAKRIIPFALPGTLKVIVDWDSWKLCDDKNKYIPLLQVAELTSNKSSLPSFYFVSINTNQQNVASLNLQEYAGAVLCVWSDHTHGMTSVRQFIFDLIKNQLDNPVVLTVESAATTVDEQLIHFATQSGALLLDGMGDGIWLMNDPAAVNNLEMKGRTYLPVRNNHQFLNNTSFSILQATRTRISKTEYISCPSCGRTLFDLQETTAKIRAVTNHLKGLKIAIMGCIVNGPGEMADADYGYVGSGPGKITLYKSKEVVKKGLSSDIAVDELIQLIKENGDWVD
jgi:(E)-4-hydroxy-3-methylbut-2-enyl-diphosphate synthase